MWCIFQGFLTDTFQNFVFLFSITFFFAMKKHHCECQYTPKTPVYILFIQIPLVFINLCILFLHNLFEHTHDFIFFKYNVTCWYGKNKSNPKWDTNSRTNGKHYLCLDMCVIFLLFSIFLLHFEFFYVFLLFDESVVESFKPLTLYDYYLGHLT